MTASRAPVAAAGISAAQAEHRLILLTVTRWLPVGIVFGLTVLLPLERGLSLAEVGVLVSLQGFVVLALELPTGALADAIGRRPVLLLSAALALVSTGVFLAAETFWVFALAIVLQGVFRALDSGPLEAWYVDTAQRAASDADVHRALSRAATALGTAIALGALLGGALVAWHPVPAWSALVLPFVLACVLYAGHGGLIALLVREPDVAESVPTARRRRRFLAAVRGVPAGIRDGGRALRASPVLRSIVLVEVFWSVAMIAFETLTPVQLAVMLGSEDAAGALFGPASAAAWGLFAVGSLLAGALGTRLGVAWVALLSRIFNGLFVVAMGLAAGVVGLLAGYGLAYLTHGAAGPAHNALLHREARADNRATVLSMNSMVAGGSYSLGVLALAPLAEAASVGVATVVAGAFSVAGALLYLPALRRERRARRAGALRP